MIDWEKTEKLLEYMYQELVKMNALMIILIIFQVLTILVIWLDGHLYRKHDREMREWDETVTPTLSAYQPSLFKEAGDEREKPS